MEELFGKGRARDEAEEAALKRRKLPYTQARYVELAVELMLHAHSSTVTMNPDRAAIGEALSMAQARSQGSARPDPNVQVLEMRRSLGCDDEAYLSTGIALVWAGRADDEINTDELFDLYPSSDTSAERAPGPASGMLTQVDQEHRRRLDAGRDTFELLVDHLAAALSLPRVLEYAVLCLQDAGEGGQLLELLRAAQRAGADETAVAALRSYLLRAVRSASVSSPEEAATHVAGVELLVDALHGLCSSTGEHAGAVPALAQIVDELPLELAARARADEATKLLAADGGSGRLPEELVQSVAEAARHDAAPGIAAADAPARVLVEAGTAASAWSLEDAERAARAREPRHEDPLTSALTRLLLEDPLQNFRLRFADAHINLPSTLDPATSLPLPAGLHRLHRLITEQRDYTDRPSPRGVRFDGKLTYLVGADDRPLVLQQRRLLDVDGEAANDPRVSGWGWGPPRKKLVPRLQRIQVYPENELVPGANEALGVLKERRAFDNGAQVLEEQQVEDLAGANRGPLAAVMPLDSYLLRNPERLPTANGNGTGAVELPRINQGGVDKAVRYEFGIRTDRWDEDGQPQHWPVDDLAAGGPAEVLALQRRAAGLRAHEAWVLEHTQQQMACPARALLQRAPPGARPGGERRHDFVAAWIAMGASTVDCLRLLRAAHGRTRGRAAVAGRLGAPTQVAARAIEDLRNHEGGPAVFSVAAAATASEVRDAMRALRSSAASGARPPRPAAEVASAVWAPLGPVDDDQGSVHSEAAELLCGAYALRYAARLCETQSRDRTVERLGFAGRRRARAALLAAVAFAEHALLAKAARAPAAVLAIEKLYLRPITLHNDPFRRGALYVETELATAQTEFPMDYGHAWVASLLPRGYVSPAQGARETATLLGTRVDEVEMLVYESILNHVRLVGSWPPQPVELADFGGTGVRAPWGAYIGPEEKENWVRAMPVDAVNPLAPDPVLAAQAERQVRTVAGREWVSTLAVIALRAPETAWGPFDLATQELHNLFAAVFPAIRSNVLAARAEADQQAMYEIKYEIVVDHNYVHSFNSNVQPEVWMQELLANPAAGQGPVQPAANAPGANAGPARIHPGQFKNGQDLPVGLSWYSSDPQRSVGAFADAMFGGLVRVHTEDMELKAQLLPANGAGAPDPYLDVREQNLESLGPVNALPLMKQRDPKDNDTYDPRFVHLVEMRSSADLKEFENRRMANDLPPWAASQEFLALEMKWVPWTELSPHDVKLLDPRRGAADEPGTVQEHDVTLVAYRCTASIGPSDVFRERMQGVHDRVVDALVRDAELSTTAASWADVPWETAAGLKDSFDREVAQLAIKGVDVAGPAGRAGYPRLFALGGALPSDRLVQALGRLGDSAQLLDDPTVYGCFGLAGDEAKEPNALSPTDLRQLENELAPRAVKAALGHLLLSGSARAAGMVHLTVVGPRKMVWAHAAAYDVPVDDPLRFDQSVRLTKHTLLMYGGRVTLARKAEAETNQMNSEPYAPEAGVRLLVDPRQSVAVVIAKLRVLLGVPSAAMRLIPMADGAGALPPDEQLGMGSVEQPALRLLIVADSAFTAPLDGRALMRDADLDGSALRAFSNPKTERRTENSRVMHATALIDPNAAQVMYPQTPALAFRRHDVDRQRRGVLFLAESAQQADPGQGLQQSNSPATHGYRSNAAMRMALVDDWNARHRAMRCLYAPDASRCAANALRFGAASLIMDPTASLRIEDAEADASRLPLFWQAVLAPNGLARRKMNRNLDENNDSANVQGASEAANVYATTPGYLLRSRAQRTVAFRVAQQMNRDARLWSAAALHVAKLVEEAVLQVKARQAEQHRASGGDPPDKRLADDAAAVQARGFVAALVRHFRGASGADAGALDAFVMHDAQRANPAQGVHPSERVRGALQIEDPEGRHRPARWIQDLLRRPQLTQHVAALARASHDVSRSWSDEWVQHGEQVPYGAPAVRPVADDAAAAAGVVLGPLDDNDHEAPLDPSEQVVASDTGRLNTRHRYVSVATGQLQSALDSLYMPDDDELGDVQPLRRLADPSSTVAWMEPRELAALFGLLATSCRRIRSAMQWGTQRADVRHRLATEAVRRSSAQHPERQRRASLWSDALREIAISNDRLYIFLRTLAGTLHESVDAVIEVNDSSVQQSFEQERSRRADAVKKANDFSNRVVQSVFASALKSAKLDFGLSGEEVVVVSTAAVDDVRRLAEGESGLGYFEAAQQLQHALSSQQSVSLSRLIENVSGVLRGVRDRQLQSLEEHVSDPLRSSFEYLSAPRNSMTVRLKAEASAAIKTAWGTFCVEWAAQARFDRRPSAWELIEGPDNILRTTFATYCAYTMSHSRIFSSTSSVYVSRTSSQTNFAMMRITLQKLVARAVGYVQCNPRPPQMSSSYASGGAQEVNPWSARSAALGRGHPFGHYVVR